MIRFVVLVYLFVSVLGQNEDNVLALFSTPQNGEGTYYGQSSSGSCTLDQNLPPVGQTASIYSTVAMNNPQYYGSLSCGMCLQMTGEGVGSGNDPIDGTFIVFVTDLCPECASGDLDVARNGDGRWDIEWIAVDCPGSYGNLQYMGQGSNDFFLKVQVRNHRIPVSQLFLLNADGQSRITMTRTNDNFFVYQASSSLSGDYTVEVEAVDGQLVRDVVNIDQIISSQPFTGKTGVQFNGIGGAMPTPAASVSNNAPSASPLVQPSSSTQASRSRTPSVSRSRDSQSFTSFSSDSSVFTSLTSLTSTDFSSFTPFTNTDTSTSSAWRIHYSLFVLVLALLLA